MRGLYSIQRLVYYVLFVYSTQHLTSFYHPSSLALTTRVHSLKLVTFDPYDIKEMHKCKAEKDLLCRYTLTNLLTASSVPHLCIFLEVIGVKGHDFFSLSCSLQ